MAKLVGQSRQYCGEFAQRMRHIALLDYDEKSVMLGGPGVIIEIDESLFAKVKHGRGKDLKRKAVWVFGMRERNSRKCFFTIVKDRERPTLLGIMIKHLRPGSIIYSDSWSAYNDISRLDSNFQHHMVNHTLHFVTPGTDIHTNGIESLWNACKRHFKSMNGCSRPFLQAYINEFCWRQSLPSEDSEEKTFDHIIKSITSNFPLSGGKRLDWSDFKFVNLQELEDDNDYFHEIDKERSEDEECSDGECSNDDQDSLNSSSCSSSCSYVSKKTIDDLSEYSSEDFDDINDHVSSKPSEALRELTPDKPSSPARSPKPIETTEPPAVGKLTRARAAAEAKRDAEMQNLLTQLAKIDLDKRKEKKLAPELKCNLCGKEAINYRGMKIHFGRKHHGEMIPEKDKFEIIEIEEEKAHY